MYEITIENTNTGRKVTVHIGKILDRNAAPLNARACSLAEQLDIQSIIVDLSQTTGIRASGLDALLRLRDEAGSRNVAVLLGDCNPEIRGQICASRLLAGFLHANCAPRVCLNPDARTQRHAEA